MPAKISPASAPDSNPDGTTSADIRQNKRRHRQQLSDTIQRHNSKALCSNITRQRVYRNSQHIACYLANDGEIDPSPIIEHAWHLGKQVYLPVLSPLRNSLYFSHFEAGSRLRLNRYNIPEPIASPSQWKRAAQLDLLLLPLVAFDTQGNRMGMGGGFYDRTLSYMQHRQHWKKPTLIGLAHEIQKVGQLKVQSWDIPLDQIVTERRRYDTD
jgi:5-formyltetrahydrofolate cyclo-ligase